MEARVTYCFIFLVLRVTAELSCLTSHLTSDNALFQPAEKTSSTDCQKCEIIFCGCFQKLVEMFDGESPGNMTDSIVGYCPNTFAAVEQIVGEEFHSVAACWLLYLKCKIRVPANCTGCFDQVGLIKIGLLDSAEALGSSDKVMNTTIFKSCFFATCQFEQALNSAITLPAQSFCLNFTRVVAQISRTMSKTLEEPQHLEPIPLPTFAQLATNQVLLTLNSSRLVELLFQINPSLHLIVNGLDAEDEMGLLEVVAKFFEPFVQQQIEQALGIYDSFLDSVLQNALFSIPVFLGNASLWASSGKVDSKLCGVTSTTLKKLRSAILGEILVGEISSVRSFLLVTVNGTSESFSAQLLASWVLATSATKPKFVLHCGFQDAAARANDDLPVRGASVDSYILRVFSLEDDSGLPIYAFFVAIVLSLIVGVALGFGISKKCVSPPPPPQLRQRLLDDPLFNEE